MKKLFRAFLSPYTSVFGSIVVYPRSRKDLSFLKNLSNLNYLFVSFFIRFSMISGQCPDPIETVACSFQGLCYIDSLFRAFLSFNVALLGDISHRPSGDISHGVSRISRCRKATYHCAKSILDNHASIKSLYLRLKHSFVLAPRCFCAFGGLKWTRTTDLVLIRHAL